VETSLHRELKRHYAADDEQTEVAVGGYRIDAVADGRLIEIQHGSLGALVPKVKKLLALHDMTVVKPLITRKKIVRLASRRGRVVSARYSPKRGSLLDLFHDLPHFVRVFPHRRLVLEVPTVEIEEHRYGGHGRRRWRRKNDFVVADQKLVTIGERAVLRTGADLWGLLGDPQLPEPFHTRHLAEAIDVERWEATRIAYCLHQSGVVRRVGRERGFWLYKRQRSRRRAA
jgi:hypothetical protein